MHKTGRFLINCDNEDHQRKTLSFLENADHFECLVAFVTPSADGFVEKLKASLGRGMTARMGVGLSGYITEPEILKQLLALTRSHNFKLYLAPAEGSMFHPKIYAFRRAKQATTLIGSANLTGGGFFNNYEASAIIDDPAFMASVTNWFDELIDDKVLFEATQKQIDSYTVEHERHNAWQGMVMRRKERVEEEGSNKGILSEFLADMRRDSTSEGFDADVANRIHQAELAREIIFKISRYRVVEGEDFDHLYESLIRCFHSTGFDRLKGSVFKQAGDFARAMEDILSCDIDKLEPGHAYQVLHGHFLDINGAGVNLLTEILHALDPARFAVMNANALSGINLARVQRFPSNLKKGSVDPQKYAQFCEIADQVRADLGLQNMLELDALFNYCYWRV